jgi:hypothetical protein
MHLALVFARHEECDPRSEIISRDTIPQTERVRAIFGEDHCTAIPKLNIYIRHPNDIPLVHQALARTFPIHRHWSQSMLSRSQESKPTISTSQTLVPPSPYNREIKPAIGPAGGPLVDISGMADTNSLPNATLTTLAKLMSARGHLGPTKAAVVQRSPFLLSRLESGWQTLR